MTTPITLDATTGGFSTFLREAVSNLDTTIRMPVGSYDQLRPIAEVDTERVTLVSKVDEARVGTTLAEQAVAGATTLAVVDGSPFDANPAVGVQNALLLGNGPNETVTVISVSGNTLTLSAPLAATWNTGTSVTWLGTNNQHLSEVVTVTRAEPQNHERHAQLSKVYTIGELETVAAQASPVTLQLQVTYPGGGFDRVMRSVAVSRTTLDQESAAWSLLFPLPAGSTFTYTLRNAVPSLMTSPAELQLWGVADAAGAVHTTPTLFTALATGATTGGNNSRTLVFDAVSVDDPATAEATIADGRVSVLTTGWYSLFIHIS